MIKKNEIKSLVGLGFFIALILLFFSRDLLCLWISLVCAYLLKKPYKKLIEYGFNQSLACAIIVSIFMCMIFLLLLVIIPPMITEAYSFLSSLPKMLDSNQDIITHFVDSISAKVPTNIVNVLINKANTYLTAKSTDGLLYLINLLPVTFEILLYFILIPIMLFFLLKDGKLFCNYFLSLAPSSAQPLGAFWQKLDVKLGSYLNGKVVEFLIVGIISLIIYSLFGLEYALLMSGLMAVSVFIPVVGAIIATIPVLFIGLWQFDGFTNELFYLLIAHSSLLIIDGNVLVPILFSERLNLHPLAILVGILLFGALFGFWGLFFAIPILVVCELLIDCYKKFYINGS